MLQKTRLSVMLQKIKPLGRQLGWFLLLWFAAVATVAAVSMCLRIWLAGPL
jgi:hypothetical protein